MTLPTRSLAWLAWLAWGLTIASAMVAIAIRVISRAPIPENRAQLGDATILATCVLTFAFATTALIITTRRPRHPVGWILFLMGGLFGLTIASAAYTFHLLATEPPLSPLTLWIAWVPGMTVALAGMAMFFLIWVFPDGRAPFRAPWLPAVLTIGAVVPVVWSFADRNWLFPSLPTPVTIAPLFGPLTGVIGELGPPMTAAVGSMGMIAVIAARARRSVGIEREQLKWFASAALLATVTLVIVSLAGWLTPGRAPLGEATLVAFQLAQTAIPVAVAIAILRYRLYEIDRIIGRTLVYGLLTAFLGVTYAVTVVVLSGVFPRFIGTGGDSLAVAAATLGVAALFQPIRHRIQLLVDRRFNRARYDAPQIAAGFAAALRDEIDLDQLTAELRMVVQRTMQPAASSVWLRPVHTVEAARP
jgi:hypothetical protein